MSVDLPIDFLFLVEFTLTTNGLVAEGLFTATRTVNVVSSIPAKNSKRMRMETVPIFDVCSFTNPLKLLSLRLELERHHCVLSGRMFFYTDGAFCRRGQFLMPVDMSVDFFLGNELSPQTDLWRIVCLEQLFKVDVVSAGLEKISHPHVHWKSGKICCGERGCEWKLGLYTRTYVCVCVCQSVRPSVCIYVCV